MINRKTRYAAVFTLIMFIFTGYAFEVLAGPVDRVTSLPGWQEKTPLINIFQIEGSSKEFILLETTKDNNSKFFVLAKDDYGKRAYDSDKTQKFDTKDPNNIAFWLNNEFKIDGNGEGNMLPSEILPYINNGHTWRTEAGRSNGNCPNDYEETAGVALMSQTEFTKHYKKFGVRDNMLSSGNGWWFRTAHGVGATPDLMLSCKVADEWIGRTEQWPAHSGLYVRPVFYLNKEFFKSCKLNVFTLGSNVKKAILKNYSIDEIKGTGYTEEEIKAIQDTSLDVSETIEFRFDDVLGRILDPSDVRFHIDFLVSGNSAKTYTIEYSVKEAGIETVYVDAVVEPLEKVTKTIEITDIKNGIFMLDITVKCGERICRTFSESFSVIPEYNRQYLDDFTRRGIVTHFANTNQTNETDAILLNRAGVRFIRDDFYWGSVERELGVYNYERLDGFIKPRLAEEMYVIGAVGYGNRLYSDLEDLSTFSDKLGLTTPNQINGYCNYISDFVRQYPEIRELEIWNEPNGGIFWKPTSVSDYTNLLKAASLAVKKADKDVKVIGAVTSGTDTSFVNNMFIRGAYPYVDAISFHPYIYPSDVDKGYTVYIERMKDTILKYGGWKDPVISEVGWSSNTGPKGVSEEKQANEIIKQFVLGDASGVKGNAVYTFREKGDDTANNEYMFGIVHRDFSGKPGYLALTQMNIKLGGALYFGEVELADGINAHLYQKNNLPLMVLWSKEGELDYDFGSEDIKAEDIIGNDIEGKVIPLNQSPVYVDGLGKNWFSKTASKVITKKYEMLLKTWETKLTEEIAGSIQSLTDYARGFESNYDIPSENEVSEKLSLHYQQGLEVISLLKNGNSALSELEVSQFLFKLHDIGIVWGNLLSIAADTSVVPATIASSRRVTELERKMNECVKDSMNGNLIYSQAMERYVKELSQNAGKAKNNSKSFNSGNTKHISWDLKEYAPNENKAKTVPMDYSAKAGVVKTWDRLAVELANWVDEFIEVEKIQNLDLLLQVSSKDATIYTGVSKDINVSVSNSSSRAFAGKVGLFDENGRLISESAEMDIPANQAVNAVLPVLISEASKSGKKDCVLKLFENGGELVSYDVQFQLLDRMEIELAPVNGTLNDAKNITLKLKNNFDQKISGELSIKAPSGWVLNGAKQAVSLESLEEKEVSFAVEQTQRVPYNFYAFDINVKDTKGNTLIQKNIPLGFTAVVKSTQEMDPGKFDGDISNWSDAYPVFISSPTQPDSVQEWHQADTSTMVFTKWDDKYFYILGNVYDNAFAQNRTSSNIWDGDCLQFSFDALNTKSSSYDKDDYEYGAARTTKGNEIYAWQVPEGETAGQKPGEWVKIIRDNTKRNTRYFLRIPKANLEPMQFQRGYSFGFNIAVNDADSDSRERWNQLTKGTADTKRPSNYHTWILLPSESAQDLEDVKKYNLPIDLTISDDEILDFNTMRNELENADGKDK